MQLTCIICSKPIATIAILEDPKKRINAVCDECTAKIDIDKLKIERGKG